MNQSTAIEREEIEIKTENDYEFQNVKVEPLFENFSENNIDLEKLATEVNIKQERHINIPGIKTEHISTRGNKKLDLEVFPEETDDEAIDPGREDHDIYANPFSNTSNNDTGSEENPGSVQNIIPGNEGSFKLTVLGVDQWNQMNDPGSENSKTNKKTLLQYKLEPSNPIPGKDKRVPDSSRQVLRPSEISYTCRPQGDKVELIVENGTIGLKKQGVKIDQSNVTVIDEAPRSVFRPRSENLLLNQFKVMVQKTSSLLRTDLPCQYKVFKPVVNDNEGPCDKGYPCNQGYKDQLNNDLTTCMKSLPIARPPKKAKEPKKVDWNALTHPPLINPVNQTKKGRSRKQNLEVINNDDELKFQEPPAAPEIMTKKKGGKKVVNNKNPIKSTNKLKISISLINPKINKKRPVKKSKSKTVKKAKSIPVGGITVKEEIIDDSDMKVMKVVYANAIDPSAECIEVEEKLSYINRLKRFRPLVYEMQKERKRLRQKEKRLRSKADTTQKGLKMKEKMKTQARIRKERQRNRKKAVKEMTICHDEEVALQNYTINTDEEMTICNEQKDVLQNYTIKTEQDTEMCHEQDEKLFKNSPVLHYLLEDNKKHIDKNIFQMIENYSGPVINDINVVD